MFAKQISNAIKKKFFYKGYGKEFEGAGKCIFYNTFVWKALSFGANNTSLKKSFFFLALGQEPTDDINDRAAR